MFKIEIPKQESTKHRRIIKDYHNGYIPLTNALFLGSVMPDDLKKAVQLAKKKTTVTKFDVVYGTSRFSPSFTVKQRLAQVIRETEEYVSFYVSGVRVSSFFMKSRDEFDPFTIDLYTLVGTPKSPGYLNAKSETRLDLYLQDGYFVIVQGQDIFRVKVS